jgi:hypothetical protein
MIQANAAATKHIIQKISEELKKQGRFKVADDQASLKVASELYIVYGSRSDRYWKAFGAGAGSCKLELRLIDVKSGEVKFETLTESTLTSGSYGGNMKTFTLNTIDRGVKDFVAGMK